MDYGLNPMVLAIMGAPQNSSKMRRNPETPHPLTQRNIEASIAGEPTNNPKWRQEQPDHGPSIDEMYHLINSGHYSK